MKNTELEQIKKITYHVEITNHNGAIYKEWNIYDINNNKICHISHLDGEQYVDIYKYNANGDVIAHKDNSWNKTSYEYLYDKNNRMIYKKTTCNWHAEHHEEWWEYDDNGNLTRYHDSEGKYIQNEYDNDGNLIHYHNSDGKYIQYKYNFTKNGKIVIKNGHDESEVFDEVVQYYDNKNNICYSFDKDFKEWWEYDDDGNLTRHYEHNRNGFFIKNYTYDSNNRLISEEDLSGHMKVWEYDNDGNIIYHCEWGKDKYKEFHRYSQYIYK